MVSAWKVPSSAKTRRTRVGGMVDGHGARSSDTARPGVGAARQGEQEDQRDQGGGDQAPLAPGVDHRRLQVGEPPGEGDAERPEMAEIATAIQRAPDQRGCSPSSARAKRARYAPSPQSATGGLHEATSGREVGPGGGLHRLAPAGGALDQAQVPQLVEREVARPRRCRRARGARSPSAMPAARPASAGGATGSSAATLTAEARAGGAGGRPRARRRRRPASSRTIRSSSAKLGISLPSALPVDDDRRRAPDLERLAEAHAPGDLLGVAVGAEAAPRTAPASSPASAPAPRSSRSRRASRTRWAGARRGGRGTPRSAPARWRSAPARAARKACGCMREREVVVDVPHQPRLHQALA